MGDMNDARREAYARRDAAGNEAAGIEAVLQRARERGDQAAVERLEIQLESKLAEIRQAAQDAHEIEEMM